MTSARPQPLEIDPSLLGVVEVGEFELPYADLNDAPYVHTLVRVADTEYVYERSYPVRGHSAIMPDHVAELLEQGKKLLVAERGERYYLYAA